MPGGAPDIISANTQMFRRLTRSDGRDPGPTAAHHGPRRALHARRRELTPRRVDTAGTAQSQYSVVPVPRISREDLKQRLDSGAPIVVIDARLKYPYEHSTVKLPGAIRVNGQ